VAARVRHLCEVHACRGRVVRLPPAWSNPISIGGSGPTRDDVRTTHVGPDQGLWINIPTGMAESSVRMIRGKNSDVCCRTSPSCPGLVRISYVKSPTAAHVQRNRPVKAEFRYNPCMRRPAEGLCLWIQWTTTIATKPHLWRHVLRSHGNEKLIEESHDLAFIVTTFGRI
jgi:hypothetical protein